METKKCSKCGEVKILNEFTKEKKSSDGYSYYCKKCNIKISKIYYTNNKEKILLKSKERYKNNKPEMRVKLKERNRDFREKNRSKRREYYKKYYEKNKEIVKERRLKNKDKYAEKTKITKKLYRLNNEVKIENECFNLNTCPEDIKPAVEAAIILKNIENKIKKIKKGESL